jgi:hypothetical protein
MGGAPEEILYDRMKTAVIGEDEAGVVTYNASLVALLMVLPDTNSQCRQHFLNFLPLPHGQGSLRPGLSGVFVTASVHGATRSALSAF